MFEGEKSNEEKNILIEKSTAEKEKLQEAKIENKSRVEIPKEKKFLEKLIFKKKEKSSRVAIVRKKPTKILERSKTFQEIEDILSEDLAEEYRAMPDELKEKFKRRGDETASKIEIIISKTKIAVNKILSLIRNWLFMISGVNKFFLEQQAKIKTDKILKLAEDKNKKKI